MSYPFLVDLLYRIIRLLVVGAVAVFFFRYGYLSIESLSGHETSAALGLDLKVSLKRTMICLAFGMVGVSGLVYGWCNIRSAGARSEGWPVETRR